MSKHVLLIDDDSDDIELFGEALLEADETAGFQYFDDASELMKQLGDGTVTRPDVIFLDINMTGISGWACLEFLKSNSFLNTVPVIMYSTSSHKKEVMQALQEGATGFVTKPGDYKALIEMLRQVLDIPINELGERLAKL